MYKEEGRIRDEWEAQLFFFVLSYAVCIRNVRREGRLTG